jgi:hypothetical protein
MKGFIMNKKEIRKRPMLPVLLALALLVTAIPSSSYAVNFAVWLDGSTSSGGNGIPSSLENAFGLGSVTLVTTANLETPGFLSAFDTVIISRENSNFGTFLSPLAAANVAAYVGSGSSQGAVALFTNDAADNFFGATTGDPFDPNLDKLFINAATFAAATHHGYIGEFNGAVQAMTSNSAGATPLGLLPGMASSTYTASTPDGHFHYDVGPIGAGNPIDAGVSFPFTDSDTTLFRTDITGALSGNIVDVYGDNGLPAVLANSAAIHGVPDTGSTLLYLGIACVVGLGFQCRRLSITRT